VPTAQKPPPGTAVTPKSQSSPRPGPGLVTVVQDEPFQCSISVLYALPVLYEPTAQASLAEVAVTALSVADPRLGLDTTVQPAQARGAATAGDPAVRAGTVIAAETARVIARARNADMIASPKHGRPAITGHVGSAILPGVESTRRGFLSSAGLTGLASLGAASTAAAGVLLTGTDQAVAAPAAASQKAASPAGGSDGAVAFHGAHQAGIATPAQEHLQFAALDMVSESRADLRDLLRTWSAAAALMAIGSVIGPVETGDKPATDTGEALGLRAASLTMTFGFGPSLFGSGGNRFGLAGQRPAPLVDLPAFRNDALKASISGGDLGVQVCADDPQVAFHAVHELIRLASPVARPRWLLAGFGRTGNSRTQSMPRNLMGFFDGTKNIMVENTAALKKSVWAAGPVSPAWIHGGSYLVARRIEIELGNWDATAVAGQEATIGRRKSTGTVLGDLPLHAHILLASPGANNGAEILRRGYSYLDGIDRALGAPAAGLMFLCYQRDPRQQFIPIQRQLAARDSLNKFVRHIGSAIFACPPGAAAGGYVGEGLLG